MIKYIKHGIACRINDRIYLHRDLKHYPALQRAIIKHEKEHTDGFTKKDIIMDFKGLYLKDVKKDYYRFIFTHPSSWTMFLPIAIYEKRLVLDPIMMGVWLLGISLGGFIWVLI